jgi:hypothetical protein
MLYIILKLAEKVGTLVSGSFLKRSIRKLNDLPANFRPGI